MQGGGTMNLLISLISAVALLLTAQHQTMPKGMSHEEHLQQMDQDEALKKRGAEAMGFDQDATTHHFQLMPEGGSIEVTVKDPDDAVSFLLVRNHLKTIAGEFARGDFGKPIRTHAEVPPGTTAMRQHADLISYEYEELPGAERYAFGHPMRVRWRVYTSF